MKPLSRTTPTLRLLLIIAGLSLLGLVNFVVPGVMVIWLAAAAAVLAVAVAELVLLSQCKAEMTGRSWTRQPTVHEPFTLTLHLLLAYPKWVLTTVETIESDTLRLGRNVLLTQGDDSTVEPLIRLTAVARQRGDVAWPGVYLVFSTWLGLIQRWEHIADASIPVYPKLADGLQSRLDPRLLMDRMGLKINRLRRADQEFESLRPYVLGDNYRHIDWKASARSQALVTRLYQVEHHHNILVCLDASRLMGTLTDGVSKLDWAIEATMQLAYLASRFNDRIGFLAFSDEIERWVKPMSHPVEAFLSNVYDLESKIVEADFQKVCLSVLTAQKKRSLVIFLSDFLDAGSLEPYLPAFGQLNRKHCSLFVGIEDPAYAKHLTSDAALADGSAEGLSRRIVALDSMRRRQAVLDQLRKMGLRSLSVNPRNLVTRLMEAYLEIKASGAI